MPTLIYEWLKFKKRVSVPTVGEDGRQQVTEDQRRVSSQMGTAVDEKMPGTGDEGCEESSPRSNYCEGIF